MLLGAQPMSSKINLVTAEYALAFFSSCAMPVSLLLSVMDYVLLSLSLPATLTLYDLH